MSLAAKDPKLKAKVHFLIKVGLYKIIDRNFRKISELVLLETAGLEYYSCEKTVSTLKKDEK